MSFLVEQMINAELAKPFQIQFMFTLRKFPRQTFLIFNNHKKEFLMQSVHTNSRFKNLQRLLKSCIHFYDV